MIVDMYKDESALKKVMDNEEGPRKLKKRKMSNMKTVTLVTTTVQKIVTVITTTKVTKVSQFDDTTCYYIQSPTSEDSAAAGLTGSEENLVKTLCSKGRIVEESWDRKLSADIEDETTTETSTVLKETVQDSDAESLYDEYTVSVIDPSQSERRVVLSSSSPSRSAAERSSSCRPC